MFRARLGGRAVQMRMGVGFVVRSVLEVFDEGQAAGRLRVPAEPFFFWTPALKMVASG
ncbi:hypothetical protein ACFWWM_26805 [Streptomyces sp. NPDC058682]|uniref:hypothetical protein n=1 Tax=Streptomyces sp. NPDC058682 TaxID=3346596 RepID=UPI003664A985